MTDLVKRLKSARGPSLDLDHAVAFATGFRPDAEHDRLMSFAAHEEKHDYATAWIAHAPWRCSWGIPEYTASIDAASALCEKMLPGYAVVVGTHQLLPPVEMPWANLIELRGHTRWYCDANTRPLAILAAMVVALGGKHGG